MNNKPSLPTEEQPVTSRPGDGFSYSNTNYLLLANDGELIVSIPANSETAPVRFVAEQVARFFYQQPLLGRPKDLDLSVDEAQLYIGDYAYDRANLRYRYVNGRLVESVVNENRDEHYFLLLNQGNGTFLTKKYT